MATTSNSYLLGDVQHNTYNHHVHPNHDAFENSVWIGRTSSNMSIHSSSTSSPLFTNFQLRYLTDVNYDIDKQPNQKTKVDIDFSVVSVAVMTLALILIVQLIRHKLENLAQSRTLFRNMLDHVYTELATLGIVEYFVYLFTTYGPSYDKAKKEVFTDVHFMLFYVAALTAIQTGFLAIVATKFATKLWVSTEMLEFSHYNELLKEFQDVSKQINAVRSSDSKEDVKEGTNRVGSAGNTIEANNSMDSTEDNNMCKSSNPSDREATSISFPRYVWLLLVHPRLRYKYNTLLMQIQFHELRTVFLQTYDMPKRFKLSEYLLRCQLQVLIKLIRIRTMAWVLLSGVFSLLYYILAIISYEVNDQKAVGKLFFALYCSCLVLFTVIVLATYRKIKLVHRVIMQEKELWQTAMKSARNNNEKHLLRKQLSLFWGNNPTYIVAAIQFMQFGFGVAYSATIIFWHHIKDAIGTIWLYVASLAACYLLFLGFIGHVIPIYTMCTNLAQMVNMTLLHETLSSFQLEQAEHQLEQFELRNSPSAAQFRTDREADKLDVTECASGIDKNGKSFCVTDKETALEDVKLKLNAAGQTDPCRNPEVGDSNERNAVSALNQTDSRLKPTVTFLSANTMEHDATFSNSEYQSTTIHPAQKSSARNDFGLKTQKNLDPLNLLPSPEESKSILEKRRIGQISKVSFEEAGRLQTGHHEHPNFNISELETARDRCSCEGTPLNNKENSVEPNPTIFRQSAEATIEFHDVKKQQIFPASSRLHMKLLVSTNSWLRKYFQSKKFAVISNLFGTAVAFFLVAKRVESFLVLRNSVSTTLVGFGIPLKVSFWMLTSYLSLFIGCSLLVLFSMSPIKGLNTINERKVVVAAMFDVTLSTCCLIFFMMAETKRCCNPYNDTVEALNDFVEDYSDSPFVCSCPRFGTRAYGGLGMLEPFTSLMSLRVFRHYLAKRIVTIYWRGSLIQENKEEMPMDTYSPFAVFSDRKKDEQKSLSRGTAVELWKEAVLANPALVNKHGIFSGELLCAMLGAPLIDVAPSVNVDNQVASVPSNNESKSTLTIEDILLHKIIDSLNPLAMKSEFSAPNEFVVRGLCRCDKKLLPILQHWKTVDVAVTKYELVFFEVIHSKSEYNLEDGNCSSRDPMALCDVADGRQLVGITQLSDIQSIIVSHGVDPRVTGENGSERQLSSENETSVLQQSLRADIKTHSEILSNTWAKTHHDVLKLILLNGYTVCLRFYSEIEDHTCSGEISDTLATLQNTALDWANEISKLSGCERSRSQRRLNRGNDHFDEERDFVQVHHTKQEFFRNAVVQRLHLKKGNSTTHASSNSNHPLQKSKTCSKSLFLNDDKTPNEVTQRSQSCSNIKVS